MTKLLTLENYILSMLPKSRGTTQAQKWVTDERIMVNMRVVTNPDHYVFHGDRIELYFGGKWINMGKIEIF